MHPSNWAFICFLKTPFHYKMFLKNIISRFQWHCAKCRLNTNIDEYWVLWKRLKDNDRLVLYLPLIATFGIHIFIWRLFVFIDPERVNEIMLCVPFSVCSALMFVKHVRCALTAPFRFVGKTQPQDWNICTRHSKKSCCYGMGCAKWEFIDGICLVDADRWWSR